LRDKPKWRSLRLKSAAIWGMSIENAGQAVRTVKSFARRSSRGGLEVMRLSLFAARLAMCCGLVLAVAVALTAQVEAQVQNPPNQKKPPPPASVRSVPQQVIRPGQQVIRPGQQVMRPGLPNQGVVGPGGAAVIPKPGVIRGPAGALRMTRPANVVFNPRHRVGLAGLHYNHQAFVFRRGHSLFRRAYYLGPEGDVFFYDDPEPPTDPAYAADASDGALPTCPEDSDDCQGLNSQAQVAPQQQDSSRASALQFLLSVRPDIGWQDDGILDSADYPDNPQLELYSQFEVAVIHYFPFGVGPESLVVRTPGLFETGYTVFRGSYDQNKPQWDRAIVALRALGVRAATPSGADRDIRSIQ
jgi:hypothetical protein